MEQAPPARGRAPTGPRGGRAPPRAPPGGGWVTPGPAAGAEAACAPRLNRACRGTYAYSNIYFHLVCQHSLALH